jgi:GNAT superfamily N-acetyltransferase
MTYLPQLHSATEDIAYSVAAAKYAQSVEVAEVDGHIVGFSLVHEGVLESLYVLPVMQGQGIGSELLVRAKAANPGGLSLWVFEKNSRARELYGRHGFVEVDRTDGSGNEENEPDLKLHWSGT